MRRLLCVSLVGLVIPALAFAADDPPRGDGERTPVMVLSTAGLGRVHANLSHVFEAAGYPEKMRTLEAFAILATAGHGAAGVDPARPAGFVLRDVPGRETVETLGLVPVEDEEAFLRLVRLYVKDVAKREDGGYDLPSDFALVVRDGWGVFYAPRDTDPSELPDPGTLLGPRAAEYDWSLTVHLSAMSQEELREFFSDEEDPEGPPSENGDDSGAADDPLADPFTRDGKDLVIGWRVSPEERRAVLDMDHTVRPGTPLAEMFAEFTARPSRFTGLAAEEADLSLQLDVPLPEDFRALLRDALDPQSVEATVQQWLPDDAPLRAQEEFAERLKGILDANAGAERFEMALSARLRGPVRMAVSLRDAEDAERLLLDLHQASGEEPSWTLKPRAARHGDMEIHAVELPASDDEVLEKLTGGEGPRYVAFPRDAFVFTAGPEALAAMKETLDTIQAPAEKPLAAPFQLQVALGTFVREFAERAAETPDEDEPEDPADAELKRLVAENFRTDDRLRVSVEVRPEGVRFRLTLGEAYYRLLAMLYGWAYERAFTGESDDASDSIFDGVPFDVSPFFGTEESDDPPLPPIDDAPREAEPERPRPGAEAPTP